MRMSIIGFAVAAMLAVPAASFAQLNVVVSGGFSAAFKELLPEFEKTSGLTVAMTSGASVGDGPNTIPARIRRGVAADVVIMSREGLNPLIAEKRTVAGSDTDLADSILGLIVRAGAPKPDISTTAAFTQTLLKSKGLALTSSTSGVYLTTVLFPKLGIVDRMTPKTTFAAARSVARGEAEIGIQQVSELLPVPGVELVGTLPSEVQSVTTYAGAIVAGSKQVEAGRKLLAFLAAPSSTSAIKKSGMEPPMRR